MWAPDKTPKCNPEWHYPTPDEVQAATSGLDAARALRDAKATARDASLAQVAAFHTRRLAIPTPEQDAEAELLGDAAKQADHDYEWEAGWVRALETAAAGHSIGAHQAIGGVQ